MRCPSSVRNVPRTSSFTRSIRADEEPVAATRKHLTFDLRAFDGTAFDIEDLPDAIESRTDRLSFLQVDADLEQKLCLQLRQRLRLHGAPPLLCGPPSAIVCRGGVGVNRS